MDSEGEQGPSCVVILQILEQERHSDPKEKVSGPLSKVSGPFLCYIICYFRRKGPFQGPLSSKISP